MSRRSVGVAALFLWAAATALPSPRLSAHHSCAMYDRSIRHVFTGVVESINPDPSHYTVRDLYDRPWARIWEEYFEPGMSRPAEDDSLGGFR
jgi:hypothetical protein